ncbi:hydroxyisourate hydrolase [Henriciella sp. AS95]|uniref:hydroxyisourate hydrolase n=1 Tax=Henriciella sp. AS95 TaxID=3135782 RepID=UPI00316D874D
MGLSTHVLDLVTGQPARDVSVSVSLNGKEIKRDKTNDDGRCADLLDGGSLEKGIYKLTFQAGSYLRTTHPGEGEAPFFDVIDIQFTVSDTGRHYHVPLLLSPYGYSTYRGS